VELKEKVATGLEEVRDRSLGLLDPVPEEDQLRQHSPLMSPLVWDLAHVGNFEELWLLRVVASHPSTSDAFDDMYNPFVHPRFDRATLPLLGPREARTYISEVRGRALDVLEDIDLDPSDPILDQGYVYGMVIQHEHQHDETMLATLQLRLSGAYPLNEPPLPGSAGHLTEEVLVEGGASITGTDIEPWAYDNERGAHEVKLSPFWIDTAPVTNAAFQDFVEQGGYDDRTIWSEAGWAWRCSGSIRAPEFWSREGGGSWARRRYGQVEELPDLEPVQHVCYHEAEAYARWRGKRLPTEIEWEKAASWHPSGRKLRFPWGDDEPTSAHANLGQRHWRPAPVGAYPAGVSPWGCHQMVGDVWEWTSSDFLPYPGFTSFPYPEYSEVFFGGDYKVLRGGSWATHPTAIRSTFRNWDHPTRRQIFAGFRCARDA
jgi:iron(II)-dependent oxidoreductase